MKLMFWNVNGIRAVHRKQKLAPVLDTVSPDIVGVQEIKATPNQLGELADDFPDYQLHWHSAEKPGYSGTGLFIKKSWLAMHDIPPASLTIQVGMPQSAHYAHDSEGRVLAMLTTVNDRRIAILNIYFPNGGKSEQAWFDKLVFYDEFLSYINRLSKAGYWVLWGGDVNCAHQEIDLARPNENEGQIGFRPEERRWISGCLDHGWVDVFRHRHPQSVVYSWWHMLTKARERNIGWRIDYAFTQSRWLERVNTISYLTEVQGSDHCPLLLDINIDYQEG